MNELFFNELTINASYSSSPKDYQTALNLIDNKSINVKDLITHHFGLDDLNNAINIAANPQDSIKIMINP